jgi:hypothetical protein
MGFPDRYNPILFDGGRMRIHYNKGWHIWAVICVNVALSTSAFGHEGEPKGAKKLIKVSLVPNSNIPEFAGASGTVAVDLSRGIFRLENLRGFPLDPSKHLPLTINLTSLTDPRLKGHDGEPGQTSCHPPTAHTAIATERSHEDTNPTGPWTCHVHSYVVWLVGLENGRLGHPVPLGTIYPRTDGTAADREFSAREGDMSGLGADTIIITAEASFGPLPSIARSHDGETSITMVPLGPIVLQATIP